MTPAERMARTRARRQQEGLERCEVYAPPSQHPLIKEYARKLLARFQRALSKEKK